MQLVASDYQEGKNINTESDSPLPNTRFAGTPSRSCAAADGHLGHAREGQVRWQRASACSSSPTTTSRSRRSASSTASARSARVQKNVAGLYEMTWRTTGKRKGAHELTAVASDVRGREAEATQAVRICK